MSIELKQAAQQALECLESLQGGCTDSDDGTVEAITVWCPEVIEALRTALQQAEPKHRHWSEALADDLTESGDIQTNTHPVPGVPEKLTVDPSGVSGTADEGYVAGWNACRDEMLTAAQAQKGK